uniref:C2H2-type domain-containing protein n=1 Tax=Loa loa TaxID=7209 RepID=A0A1I7VCS5_LOALO
MEFTFENVDQIGPNLPNLGDLKNYLREEKPLYYQALEKYLRNAARLINDLRAKLERSEHEAHDGGRVEGTQPENEEDLVPHPLEQQQCEEQEMIEPVPALVHDEAEGGEEDEIAEWSQVPHEPSLNEEVVNAVPRAPVVVRKRREVIAAREIVLRSRTIQVPIVEEVGHEAVPASPVAFHVPVVEGLPAHYQELLVVPEIDPYKIIRNDDGSVIIGCGMCPKEFGTLKGWRIHAAKMHTQNGFCHKCGHFVRMAHVRTIEEIAAMMELHSSEWCPKATKAVVSERAAKRRRLELVGNDNSSSSSIHAATKG